MATYENEFSNFPTENITLHKFKNVDDTIAPIINQINALRAQGLYSSAQVIINTNKELLSQYIIDATTIRTLEEEIYNTQKFAKKQQQVIFFDEEEPDAAEGDVWLGN